MGDIASKLKIIFNLKKYSATKLSWLHCFDLGGILQIQWKSQEFLSIFLGGPWCDFVLNSWHQEVCIRCSYTLEVGLAILVDIAGDVHRSSGQEPICEQ